MEINVKKLILSYSFAIALLLVVHAGATRVSAQMVGAYGDASVSSKEVVRAANFAVSKQPHKGGQKVKLVEIVFAQQQLVAGENYCVVMTVADKRGTRSTATAVVYEDLKDHLKLISWASGDHRM
ncbi:MAG TPA: cystatin domain-containing protein [Pyrinomonadaceae bacterium]|nr:cystatin domain-containing protein [Pyrinomonadaceae bacterium]